MRLDDEHSLEFLEMYLGRKPTREEELRLFLQCAFTGLRWYTWANCKMILGGAEEFYIDFAVYSMDYAQRHYDVVKEYLK